MAKSSAVWGIDIGQCAIKALRCSPHPDDPSLIVADAFDYIEFPKILSQPDAEPAELVREALEQFLSRNEVRGDRVAISVSGQSGLARFIKLPPVEAKKIPDIVKYEARQQIPFSLEDVVWDYQQLAGGIEDDGFALETEVGLFAMKRDQVFRALKPLDDAGIKIDIIQLTPLAIYNYIVFDQQLDATPLDEYDPEEPPPSTVVVSLGTDTTDLVVTNGFRVWQRSIPIGGNHFTKALTKELRLTFSKAEHLKRHATEAENPKAVFQAMRPIFNDLLTEIQRSIGYFSNMDPSAKISGMVALGNAMKLPGLSRYLSQNLGHEVQPATTFRGLTGSGVTDSPQFKDNLLSFGTCYGLCLQGLKKSSIHTNLLPREIVTERLINEKRPWAIAMAAALLLGCTINYFGYWAAFRSADVTNPEFKSAINRVTTVTNASTTQKSDHTAAEAEHTAINAIGKNLVDNLEGRVAWLEVLTAIDTVLPRDPDGMTKLIEKRLELHIESLDCEKFEDLSTWFAGVAEMYQNDHKPSAADAAVAPAADASTDAAAAPSVGPTGPGWVIQLSGHHYFNKDIQTLGPAFVRQTLLSNLKDGEVELPDGTYTLKELGFGYPVIVVAPNPVSETIEDQDANAAMRQAPLVAPLGANPARGVAAAAAPVLGGTKTIDVLKSNFIVQFCWQRVTPSQRLANREAAQLELESGTPVETPAADETADTAAETDTAAAELANAQQ